MLLPKTALDGARTLAERIRAAIATGSIRRNDRNEQVGNITVSIGVAGYATGETVEQLIGRADGALYVSKQSGRNRVTVAYPAHSAQQEATA